MERFFRRYAFLLLSYLFMVPGFCLYNGNPALPEIPEEGFVISKESWLSIKAGYQGDIVFERTMKMTTGCDDCHQGISSFESTMNSGTFSMGFMDRVELYGLIGSYQLDMGQNPLSNTHIHYKTDRALGYQGGVRAIVAYWGETKMGVDAKYFVAFPDIHSIHLHGSSVETRGAEIRDQQWQLGIGISHKISFFIPYIGINYLNVNTKVRHLSSLKAIFPKEKFTIKNTYPVGLFFGFSLAADRALSASLEARIFDETAATAAIDFRF